MQFLPKSQKCSAGVSYSCQGSVWLFCTSTDEFCKFGYLFSPSKKQRAIILWSFFIKKFTKSFAEKNYCYRYEYILPFTFTTKSDIDTGKHPYRFLFDIQNVGLLLYSPITLRLRYNWIFQGLLPSCSSEPAVSKCHPQNVP